MKWAVKGRGLVEGATSGLGAFLKRRLLLLLKRFDTFEDRGPALHP